MKKSSVWDPYQDFQQTILPNGLEVHSAFWDRACVHVLISVHSGATSDPKGKEGLTHFVEHLLNSQIEKDEQVIESLGGSAKFGTTRDFVTDFSFTVPIAGGAVAKALKIFAKMLGEVPSEIVLEKERNIILQEFYRNYPTIRLNELRFKVFKNAYQGTPFENFIGGLGVPDTIKAISIADAREFFNEHYVPSNMSIVVAGGLKHQEVVKCVQENFVLPFKQGRERKICPSLPEIDPPKNTEEIVVLSQFLDGLVIENATLMSYAIVPGCFSYESLRICRSALGKMLAHEIREKKQATYDVSVKCGLIGGCYDFEIETMFNPENLEMVRKAVNASFEKIRSRKHFERNKKALIMGYATCDPNMREFCDNAQTDLINCGRIKANSEEISNLQAVSFEQYCKLLDYLADPKRWWSLIQVP